MKKICMALLGSLAVAGFVFADTAEVEVEVRFIEIAETTPPPASLLWQLDPSVIQSLSTQDARDLILSLDHSGSADLLSAPRVRTQSGKKATIKVVTEYRYPTDVELRPVSITNGEEIVRTAVMVPSQYETRDVGITLNVTPVIDAQRDMIDLDIMAEVVSEPTWKEYSIVYEATNGVPHTVKMEQPFFHTREIDTTLCIPNNSTVAIGGMVVTFPVRVDDRVPYLGAIPWLGRLFRNSEELHERRHLIITVSAKIVGEK